jgi:hypothetical protein
MRILIVGVMMLIVSVLMHAAETTEPRDLKLFLLIGQSNMAGRGVVEPQDQIAHPRVFVLTKELAWAPALDPLHFDKPERTGVGLASSFGRTIADEQTTSVVGLIPAAFGGTSLDEWKPGGALYTNAVARAREAMKRGTLVGILWHQGENDAAPELAATYPERFAAMIAQLRQDLEVPGVPVIVGELGRFVENSADINAALAKVPAYVSRSAFVSSEGLTEKGDKLHFDSVALREFGRRYAKAWKAMAAHGAP